MVLWVVMMLAPCLRALVFMNLSGFKLGAWELLKMGMEGEDLLRGVFSQSLHT